MANKGHMLPSLWVEKPWLSGTYPRLGVSGELGYAGKRRKASSSASFRVGSGTVASRPLGAFV